MKAILSLIILLVIVAGSTMLSVGAPAGTQLGCTGSSSKSAPSSSSAGGAPTGGSPKGASQEGPWAATIPPEAVQSGVQLGLTEEQAKVAAIIVRVTKDEGLPVEAAVIALTAASQESGIRNLPYGDRDSLGVFQERPSQGWGTPAQVMDPVYATQKFYEHLKQMPRWETLPFALAAQLVELSGHPDRYLQWVDKAKAVAAGLWKLAVGALKSGAAAVACSVPRGVQLLGDAANALQKLHWNLDLAVKSIGWVQIIPVPAWPADLPGARVNPAASTPQCVAGALWSWAAMHEGDPRWNHVPFIATEAAGNHFSQAQAEGFQTSNKPEVGAMAVWRIGSYYGGYGHIGTVLVVRDTSYLVLEQNFKNTTYAVTAGSWGTWDIRWISWPDPEAVGFIVAPPK